MGSDSSVVWHNSESKKRLSLGFIILISLLSIIILPYQRILAIIGCFWALYLCVNLARPWFYERLGKRATLCWRFLLLVVPLTPSLLGIPFRQSPSHFMGVILVVLGVAIILGIQIKDMLLMLQPALIVYQPKLTLVGAGLRALNAVVLNPAAEEIFYRAFVMGYLVPLLGMYSILISVGMAVMTYAIGMFGPLQNKKAFMLIRLADFIFALVYYFTGSLPAVVIGHSLLNVPLALLCVMNIYTHRFWSALSPVEA